MTFGLGVFIAFAALGVALASAACILTARSLGSAAAAKEGAVLALSLGAYVAVCTWFGFGAGAQTLALVASAVPLRAGRKYVLPLTSHARGDH